MPSGYHAYPQQLYGCLVHSKPGSDYKGGFFGYLIGPDNLRPHQFFFELVGAAGEQYVGMNYKRFACDKTCWNTTKDVVLLNYTPNIETDTKEQRFMFKWHLTRQESYMH